MNNSSKSNTLFLVICIVLIVVFIVLFLYVRGMNNELRLKYEKNVFFVELDNKPYEPFDAFEKNNEICIKGNLQNNKEIDNEHLKIDVQKPQFLLMCWIKFNSKYIFENAEDENAEDENTQDEYTLLNFNNANRYKLSIKPFHAKIEFEINSTKTNLVNVPFDKWFCLATLYTNNYSEIYLDGKLADTISTTNGEILNNEKLTIGKFPGYLAYLVVSVNDTYFNSYSIYQEYLYYKNKIFNSEKYKQNFKHNYEIALGRKTLSSPHSNDLSNTCND